MNKLFAVGGVALLFAACSNGASQKSARDKAPDRTSASATPTATSTTTGQAGSTAATLTATGSSGDSAEATLSFGEPQPVGEKTFAKATGCGDLRQLGLERAMAVPMQGTVKSTTSLATTIQLHLSAEPKGNPFAILFNFKSGLACGGNIRWESVSPGASQKFAGWLLYPSVITPNTPNGDLNKMGTQLLRGELCATSACATKAYGPRVIDCSPSGAGLDLPPGIKQVTVQIVPAGTIPQSIPTGTGTDPCTVIADPSGAELERGGI